MITQIGLPVVFSKRTKHKRTNELDYYTRDDFAAIIIDLKSSPKIKVTLRIFTKTNNPESYIEHNVQHKDFAKDNTCSYWDFLRED